MKKIKKKWTMNKVFLTLTLLLVIIALPITLFLTRQTTNTEQHAAGSSWKFITRNGSILTNNGSPFRFAGANIHWLGLLSAQPPIYPPQTRIATVLQTAQQMHATVIRSGTLGVSVGCSTCIEPSLNMFNDAAFAPIDYAIEQAKADGIRLIIPLTDNYHYYPGGKHTFTDWRGLSNEDMFYSNPTVIQDYKNYIIHILDHVNQYTGVPLKDDPTILAWETGNELQNATGLWDDNWTEQIAVYIKSIAPNQLIADGHQANYYKDLTPSQLQLPSVDLYTSHLYPISLTRVQASAQLAQTYHKAYYIGEYDWTGQYGGDAMPALLSGVETHPNAIAGDLYWELYDNGYSGDKYTLHFPGDNPMMQQRAQALANHALFMSFNLPTPTGVLLTATEIPIPTLTVTPTPIRKQTTINRIFFYSPRSAH